MNTIFVTQCCSFPGGSTVVSFSSPYLDVDSLVKAIDRDGDDIYVFPEFFQPSACQLSRLNIKTYDSLIKLPLVTIETLSNFNSSLQKRTIWLSSFGFEKGSPPNIHEPKIRPQDVEKKKTNLQN